VEITHVLDTHVHADHLSGGRDLAARLGVPYHLGERATERDLGYEFTPLADGETIAVGDVEIETLFAPGHTSETVAYRVGEEAVLTGDSLFLDSVGRTELEFGEDEAEQGARMQYEALHGTLLELPKELTVLPGHVTVNADGTYANASPGELVGAPLGEVHERLGNPERRTLEPAFLLVRQFYEHVREVSRRLLQVDAVERVENLLLELDLFRSIDRLVGRILFLDEIVYLFQILLRQVVDIQRESVAFRRQLPEQRPVQTVDKVK